MNIDQTDEHIIRVTLDPNGAYRGVAKLVPNWIEPVPIRVMGAFDYVVKLPWFQHERAIDRDELVAILAELEIDTYSIYRQIVGYEVCGDMKAVANRYLVEIPNLVQAIILRLSI